MASLQWRFREMTRAEMNQDPMQREFFEGEPINTRLVRESIQNSLDAAIARTTNTNAPVRVRFSLAGIHNPLPPHIAQKYFDGLAPHLNALPDPDAAIGILAAQDNLTRNGVRFIVVEDAGTVGLEGDWNQDKDSQNQPANNNHFYWFFRNVGRSGKGDSDNGSWGLGKWVFPDASHASAYIAVTRRHSDDETLLMGQSVLKQHDIDGQHYAPYGYFAEFADDDFQLPLRRGDPAHAPAIDECISDFDLRYRSEPGLSIIIPFARIDETDARIDTSKMLAAVIHNYFYPILARKLEVTLDEGDGSPPIEITADTLDDALNKVDDLEESGERSLDAYRALFKMTRRALSLKADDYRTLNVREFAKMSSADYPGIAALRRGYNTYSLLAFRVQMDSQRKNDAPQKGEFMLYAEKDDALPEGHDYYVRGTLSISEEHHLGRIRARTLLVVNENEQLAAMLRDSEPPAHTSWRTQTARARENWVASDRRIREIRNAPLNLLRAMDIPNEGLQKDVFADIFPRIPPKTAASNGKRGGGTGGPVNPPPPPASQDFAVSEAGAGFRVRLNNPETAAIEYARLQVAYDVPKGNPLKRYHPTDFRLQDDARLEVQLEGCAVQPATDGETPGNTLRLHIQDPRKFSVSVQGFDPNRDVYVRVEKVSPNESEEET